ncbi:hypothetical protein JTB14_032631 [Gonioctena quinquepunctata]|nr:hypothetical protein JTB14_032631 [Gonioctena quinquepunctata]
MTDIRYLSKDFMSKFIRVYREHTSLWKVKSKEYRNKNLKNLGITKLIEVCQQFNIMEADKDFVLKKIQSMRGSFRKELGKVKDSQRRGAPEGDIYVPTLWYFDLLQFTVDQESATESISKFESASESFEESKVNLQVMEEDNSENEEEIVKPYQLSEIPTKRAKISNCIKNESTSMFMKACTDDALSAKSTIIEEFQAVGMNVSAKLQKMKPTQQVYAEFFIQKVLTWGALEKLTENTDLINSPNENPSIASGI